MVKADSITDLIDPSSLDLSQCQKKAIEATSENNDAADFRDVSVMPTVNEIKCTQRPYLPGPAASNSCSAHVERQFRLLRLRQLLRASG